MLQPGDRVGRYEIQSIIGEGGFGKVYLAWDSELGRPVAIKALSSERQAREPAQYAEYRERFRLECQVQGQFHHPHIVGVYDMVQQNGNEYLVEEYVDGGSLHELIQQEGHLPPERVVQIGIEMCQAIAAVWEQDVVHRDVKPSNILLTDDDRAKLTDFGVAQIGQRSQRTHTDSHHPGTPTYMSPEQEKGYGYLDERSDLYALGLVLYEALTAKPFKRERVAVRQLMPTVHKELEKVVMRALAHDPADRYQRAAEFEAALRRTLNKARPAWLWWVGGGLFILLALVAAQWSPLQPWKQDSPLPTAMRLPSQTPTVSPTPTLTGTPAPTSTSTPTSTARPTAAPTATASPSATPTSFATATLVATATPRPTRTLSPAPVLSAPRLLSPLGAAEIRASHLTLRWDGDLPDAGYGFRVSLRHGSGAPGFSSPTLDGKQWSVELEGDAVGEWRWSVAVVRQGETQALARSDEWTFYYNPFEGPSPTLDSPLPTP